MTRKMPEALTVDLNLPYPRWICSVSDGIGTANGGFLKRFKTHAELYAWMDRHGYTWNTAIPHGVVS